MSATKAKGEAAQNGNGLPSEEANFRQYLDNRIAELEAVNNDLARLKSIRAALDGATPQAATTGSTGSRTRRTGRKEQFVQIVRENPGITISEAAKKMTVAPNYLYRVREQAIKDGTVRRDGANLFPAEPVAA